MFQHKVRHTDLSGGWKVKRSGQYLTPTTPNSNKAAFAEFVEFDTYSRAYNNMRQNGDLQREIRKIPSSHSILHRLGIKFKSPYENRLFDCWWVWNEIKHSNGTSSFMVGIAPIKDYRGQGFDEVRMGDFTRQSCTSDGRKNKPPSYSLPLCVQPLPIHRSLMESLPWPTQQVSSSLNPSGQPYQK